MATILSIFDAESTSLKIDSNFVKKVAFYQASFTTKNEDHIRFFGGKLLGVEVVRFTQDDEDEWFDDILQMDEQHLRTQLLMLPDINKDWKVSSDTFNLSCVWLLHKVLKSSLGDHDKQETMISIALMLQYKFFTSLLYRYFKYPADKGTAAATYAALSKRFTIKEYESWADMYRAWSIQLIEKNSKWRSRVINDMESDRKVVEMLNSVQGRIRSMMKFIYGVFMDIHKQGIKINSVSATVEFDGEEILRDRDNGLNNYIRYLHSVVADKNSFIREELVTIITKAMPSVNPRMFKEVLSWISDNYQRRNTGAIDELIDNTLIHSFDYLKDNRSLVKSTQDLAGLLTKLKGTYTAARTTNETVALIRTRAEEISQTATGNKNSNTLAALRTSLLMYICLRTYTMHFYSRASV